MRNTKIARQNLSIDEVSEANAELKYVKIEINEQNRVVPVVQFAFHDRIPDGCDDMPNDYFEDDFWDESFGCNVQPVSNTVRVLIRPDVSKQEAINILIKMMWLIDQDKHDWELETENYLNRWEAQIALDKRENAVKSAA